MKRLGEPLPAVVRADDRGRPLSVDGRSVDAIRESWLVEDRWWTAEPVRRRYWEIVTVRGELLILFRDLRDLRERASIGGAKPPANVPGAPDLRERASIGGAEPPANVPGAPDHGSWYRQR